MLEVKIQIENVSIFVFACVISETNNLSSIQRNRRRNRRTNRIEMSSKRISSTSYSVKKKLERQFLHFQKI